MCVLRALYTNQKRFTPTENLPLDYIYRINCTEAVEQFSLHRKFIWLPIRSPHCLLKIRMGILLKE